MIVNQYESDFDTSFSRDIDHKKSRTEAKQPINERLRTVGSKEQQPTSTYHRPG